MVKTLDSELDKRIFNLIEDNRFEAADTCLNKKEKRDNNYWKFKTKIDLKSGKKTKAYLELIDVDSNYTKSSYLEFLKDSFIDDKISCKNIFITMKKKFKLNNTDLDFLIKNEIYYLIKFCNGMYLKSFILKSNTNNLSKLEYSKISENNKMEIIGFIEKSIKYKHFLDILKYKFLNKEYDLVIDGFNLLHTNKNLLLNIDNINNFLNSLRIIKSRFKNPLIIFPRFIKKKGQKINLKSNQLLALLKEKLLNDNINYFETPVFTDHDDNYILYAGVYNDVPILTNDNFKDHKNRMKNEYFNQYIINNKFRLNELLNWKRVSKYVQLFDNDLYIPTKNGFHLITLNER
jgi:hypothetical protein